MGKGPPFKSKSSRSQPVLISGLLTLPGDGQTVLRVTVLWVTVLRVTVLWVTVLRVTVLWVTLPEWMQGSAEQ